VGQHDSIAVDAKDGVADGSVQSGDLVAVLFAPHLRGISLSREERHFTRERSQFIGPVDLELGRKRSASAPQAGDDGGQAGNGGYDVPSHGEREEAKRRARRPGGEQDPAPKRKRVTEKARSEEERRGKARPGSEPTDQRFRHSVPIRAGAEGTPA